MSAGAVDVLPVALAAAGWTAIGAVGGAFIGATAGAAADAFFNGRRERRLAKAGSRLVARDVWLASRLLQQARTERKWWVHFEFSIANWDEYRGVLATTLTDEDFATVSKCIITLKLLFDHLPTVPAWPAGSRSMDLPEKLLKEFDAPLEEAIAVQGVLAKWGGPAAGPDEETRPKP